MNKLTLFFLLTGLASLVYAAFLTSIALGFAVVGLGLIVLGALSIQVEGG